MDVNVRFEQTTNFGWMTDLGAKLASPIFRRLPFNNFGSQP
jgi:hypothetical protein